MFNPLSLVFTAVYLRGTQHAADIFGYLLNESDNSFPQIEWQNLFCFSTICVMFPTRSVTNVSALHEAIISMA